MAFLKGLVKRLCMTVVTAAATLPGMAVGSALAADTPTDGWIKICQKDEKAKKELCQTAYELRTPDGQFLATFMVLELSGEARRIARMIVPTGMLLQPGIKVQIDQNKPEEAKYAFCAPDGCISEMLLSDATFAAMKKGKTLAIGTTGQAANPVSFNFGLDSFKAANEGKPLEPDEIKKRAQAIVSEIQQKRKTLEEQLKDAQHKAQQTE
ncbi:MAG: invasion associated locus B family protein [Ancalomicrobiaceae bacterium]|nr:invasion associated locus B family protein [Ancalomicrobiaceae bacterium]